MYNALEFLQLDLYCTADFIQKGIFSVHSFYGDYLSISKHPDS